MKNHSIQINKEDLFPMAKKYFLTMTHCNEIQESSYLEDAMEAYFSVKDQLSISGVSSFYDSSCIRRNHFSIDKEIIPCNVLEQFTQEDFLGVFVYMIGIQDIEYKNFDMLESFYCDIWMNAYVEASRDYLKEYFAQYYKEHLYSKNYYNNQIGIYLSDSFGPGFYGMGIAAVNSFFHILDGSEARMDLTKKGIISPIKSNVGFYLVFNKEVSLPSDYCRTCVGSQVSCSFCKGHLKSYHSE